MNRKGHNPDPPEGSRPTPPANPPPADVSGRRNHEAIVAYQHGWDDRQNGRRYRRNVGRLQWVDDYDAGWNDCDGAASGGDLRRALNEFKKAVIKEWKWLLRMPK